MNLGATMGGMGTLFALLIWALPVALLVWLIRTLAAIAPALRDIALRLDSLERAVRDAARSAPPNGR